MSEGPTEREIRIVYSLTVAAVRLAKVFGVPLRQMVELVQLAYFRELRQDGLSIEEIGERLDVSLRSAARLSKQLKSDFFTPESEHDLPRRLEFLLWAEPLGFGRIKSELGIDDDDLEAALAVLVRENRVVEVPPSKPGRVTTYKAHRPADRLVGPDWARRIGSLNSLMANVAAVTWSRFVAADELAFARNLVFHVRHEDKGRLREFYEDTVWPFFEGLDRDANGARDTNATEAIGLSLFWSRHDPIPPAGRESDTDTETDHE